MDRFKHILICFAFVIVSCTKQDVVREINAQFSFIASSGDIEYTKTVLGDDGSIKWLPGDKIRLFWQETEQGRTGIELVSDNTEVSSTAKFDCPDYFDGAGSSTFWAVYPNELTEEFDNGSFVITLPDTQVAQEGSFANNLFPSIAKTTDNNLNFYNVCGGIGFSVTAAGIKTITVSSKNGEALAGKVKVSLLSNGLPYIEEVIDPKTSVSLTCPNSTFKPGAYYYITLLPCKLSNGVNLKFYNSIHTTIMSFPVNAIEVKRAIWGVLNQVENRRYKYKIVVEYTTALQNKIPNEVQQEDPFYYDAEVTYTHREILYETPEWRSQANPYRKYRLETYFSTPVTKITRKGKDGDQYSVTAITLPSTIEEIGDGLLSGFSIESFDLSECNNLKKIGSSLFGEGGYCKSIILPEFHNLESIGSYAFEHCIIKEISFLNNSVTNLDIGEYAFKNTALESFNLGNCTLKRIKAGVFYGTKLSHIDFGPSAKLIEEISDELFCKTPFEQFEWTLFPNLRRIGTGAFSETKLASLDLSPCPLLVNIGDSAFEGCQYLSELNLDSNNSLKEIGDYAFSKCGLTALDLSQCVSIETIGAGAFEGNPIFLCSLPPFLESFSARMLANTNINYLDLSQFSFWTEIKSRAFSEIPLSTLILPKAPITRIGSEAFYNTSLSELDLSELDQLTTIDNKAFYMTRSLKKILIPASVETIGSDSFASSGVEELDLSSHTSLSKIPLRAFMDSSIKRIKLSKTINRIEQQAFNYSSLETCEIPEDSELSYVGQYAFTQSSLKNISFENAKNLTTIDYHAFSNCNSLKVLILPENLSYMGNEIISGCNSYFITIYVKAITPPTMLSLGTYPAYIYVPEDAFQAYREAEGWKDYSSRIKKYNFNQ